MKYNKKKTFNYFKSKYKKKVDWKRLISNIPKIAKFDNVPIANVTDYKNSDISKENKVKNQVETK